MSLHAQTTPEARRLLSRQRRQSTIASLLISILVIVLFSFTLAILLVQGLSIKKSDLTITPRIKIDKPVDLSEPTFGFQKTPSAPSATNTSVIASVLPKPTSVPVPEVVSDLPSLAFIEGNDFGSGFQDGADSGLGRFQKIPVNYGKRCNAEERLARLKESGGSTECEAAVLRALRYLKTNQKADGSWGQTKPVAMTGLSLLAFLGHCETPQSIEFGDTVTQAITYLVHNNSKQNGKSASDLQDKHWCYEHAIALYALSETYSFCKAENSLDLFPQLETCVTDGINWIVSNQHASGGWDYSYDISSERKGDSSITAWQLQAIKAGMNTGIRFNKLSSTVHKALNYLEECQNKNGGFGYQHTKQPVGGANAHFTLTGAGVLCFQQYKGSSNSKARSGVRYISNNLQFDYAQNANLYEHYYISQALINHGGDTWKDYNNQVRDELLKHQATDGSWPNPGGNWTGKHNDTIYFTCLSTLMLEVYYRYLPSSGAKP